MAACVGIRHLRTIHVFFNKQLITHTDTNTHMQKHTHTHTHTNARTHTHTYTYGFAQPLVAGQTIDFFKRQMHTGQAI